MGPAGLIIIGLLVLAGLISGALPPPQPMRPFTPKPRRKLPPPIAQIDPRPPIPWRVWVTAYANTS